MMRFLLLPLFFLAACALAQTSPLNDTGQTQCFQAGTPALGPCTQANAGDAGSHTRQDGRFGRDAQAGAGALTKVGAGAAGFDFTKIANNGSELPVSATLGSGSTDWACTRDNVTGLIWEVKTPANANDTFTFADASAVHAAAVNADQLCGFTNWRVPTRRELLSIVHHGTSSPAIDTTFFPNTQSGEYLTSDIFALGLENAWVVGFNDGDAGTNSQSSLIRVRLVSGTVPPEPSPRFVDNLDGTVTDPATGLMWDRCAWGQTGADCAGDSASDHNWQAALGIAVTANTDNHRGYSDWRLPNSTELHSLLDITTFSPAINMAAFPNAPSGFFWSSTAYSPFPANAWNVNFGDGNTFAIVLNFDGLVRLVRSGQSFDASPVTVNTLDGGNDGVCGGDGQDEIQDCSLLEAIALANSAPTPAVIGFSVDGVIPISSSVVITTPVTIDGTTAPGGAHAVRINATGAGGDAIQISGPPASGSEVRGLVIGQSPAAGLAISSGAANVRILGNYIGTNADGDDLGNGSQGVVMIGGATDNTIGGAAPGEGNTIGFNGGAGVFLFSSNTTGNVVVGNFIGTNADGEDLGNAAEGVVITAASSGNTIGGATSGDGNTIGFNDGEGVTVAGADTSGNSILGNFIGTNAAGNDLGNGFDGVTISGGATDNAIGGTSPGEGNSIGFNGFNGVVIAEAETTDNRVLGNYIGTNADGASSGNALDGVRIRFGAADNTIEGNTIGFNGGNGVALSSSNTTGNVVVGNFIGTNAAGDDLGNAFFGASIAGGATDNAIGGAGPGEGNTIGFNGIYGVDIFDPGTSNNRVLGNFIGTNADGDELGNSFDGLAISGGATDNAIGGAALGEGNTIGFNGTNGVIIAGAGTTNNRVLGNFIGADAAGNMLANGLSGVRIESGAMNNSIGGTALDAANTIGFSNAEGVRLNGVSGNHVLGNFIGTNAVGDDLGNAADGVVITGASTGNTIGGAASGEGNTIGFNDGAGVFLSSSDTTGNIVIGNFIGTNPAGVDLGNGFQGIAVFEGATNNMIGGTAPGEGNTIGFNNSGGLRLSGVSGNRVLGNYIGTNAAGDELGNDSDGVAIAGGATDNTIGGSEPGEGNSIGFNAFNGVLIAEAETTDNRVLGNFIGTNGAGNMLANGVSGVRIVFGAANNTIEGNTIGFNGFAGVSLFSSDTTGNVIVGNFIGTNAAGQDLGNGFEGIVITAASTGNTIGGTAQGESNTIGFNDAEGVKLTGGASGNRVIGNFIGTNAAGDDLGNGSLGVAMAEGATNNTIGGATPGEGNTIGFNNFEGVLLASGAFDNRVLGNFIGTNATGDMMGNGFHGVAISEGATDNTIGGTELGEGNTIGFNGTNGVIINGTDTTNNRVLGNFIGTNAAGNASGNGLDGVRISGSATNNVIGGASPGEGNTIGFNSESGVSLFSSGTTGNVIVGNFIGTNADGDDLGHPSRGVLIANGASGNTIGGAAPGEGNTIGFNGLSGVWVVEENTTGNVMIGNFIGTNAQGEDLGNFFEGIVISGGATNNTVGGAAPGEGNTIAFNGQFGVKVDGAGTTDNRVLGNFIGTNATGSDLGNLLNGVGVVRGATRNLIGGVAPGAGNTVRFNGDNGVLIAASATIGNAVLGNAIFDNATLGIDLSIEATIGDGVTANDGCNDPDQGPNGLQNFPALLSAKTGGGITTIDFVLDTAVGDYRVEFFSVLAADASGHGEGRTFLAAEEVSVSADCDETFLAVLPFEVATDRLVTATATLLDEGQPSGFGGTSEFSTAVIVEIADRVFEDRFQQGLD